MQNHSNPISKIPHFPGHWLLGNTLHFAKDTLGFVNGLREKYPEGIVHTKIAFRDFYVLLKPEFILHVLQKEHKKYQKSFAYDGLKDFLGQGLLTSEGDFWFKQRRAIQPGFHKKQLGFLANAMVQQVGEFMGKWEQKGRVEVNMQEEMLALTRDLVSIAIFGEAPKDPSQAKAMGEALTILRNYANNKMKNPFKAPLIVPTSENIAFRKAQKTVEHFISEGLQLAENNEFSLVHMLLNHETPMDKQKLYDELLTLYIAGQETTTNALSFLFYLLDQNPSYVAKLRDELQQEPPVSSFEEIRKLKNVRPIIQESLRLFPPAWAISRQCIQEDILGDYKIPKGATVFLSIYAMHRHSQFWENPDTFWPERFLQKRNNKAYMPFGLGPRMCIGNELAMMEMEIIIVMLFQRFDICYIGHKPLELITPMTLAPKFPMTFELRESHKVS